MKDHPIIFSTEMVRAILEGRKTMTRRPIKPQPIQKRNGWFDWGYKYGAPKKSSPKSCFWHAETWRKEGKTAPIDEYCPYGGPGDRLWVRETWMAMVDGDEPNYGVTWKASGTTGWRPWKRDDRASKYFTGDDKWRPSIHMPKWACRLWLEITGVRVERVQEIDPSNAIEEGIYVVEWHPRWHDAAIDGFKTYWDSLYAKKPGFQWEANPWVRVIEFRRDDGP